MMKFRKAFTLLEINLAIMIMAGGILSVMGLYSLGFRESRQSEEDVASAAYADEVLGQLTMAISATNLKWSVFREIGSYPDANGWKSYFDSEGLVTQNPESKAKAAFSSLMGKLSGASKGTFNMKTAWPAGPEGLKAGLVVLHEEGSPIVKLAFRATKIEGLLLASPLYYTEVRFQGIADE